MKTKTLRPFISLAALISVTTAEAELIAHWPLDADGTDATGNGFDGNIIGTVDFGQPGANANTGTSAAFPDTGHLDVLYNEALNPKSFTVTMWANAATTDGYASVITNRDDFNLGVSTHGFVLYNDNNGLWSFWSGDGNPGWDLLDGSAVETNTWTHLAISYDSITNTKVLWINGVEAVSEEVPPPGPPQYSPNGTVEMENLHIGSGSDTGEALFFDGLIDDVALWNVALDQSIIQSIMANGVAAGLPDPGFTIFPIVDLELNGGVQTFEIPITNDGQSQNLTVTSVEVIDGPNFSVSTLPADILPGETGNIVLSFDPAGNNGLFEADLQITSNDELVPVKTITVRGSIHDPMVVADALLDLETQTTATTTISNTGASRTLNISSVTITGDDAAFFTIASSPASLAPGATGDIVVNFNSSGVEGVFRAVLEIASDDPLVPTALINLRAEEPFGSDLVAWWPLDFDATDASGNGFDGVISGVLFQEAGANGNTGGSLSFDGSSTRIDVDFSELLNPESFTVTLWALARSIDGFASPITSRDDFNNGVSTHGYILYNDNSGIWNFWTGDGNPGWDQLPGNPVEIDTWAHLAITYDAATNTKKIFTNGVEVNSEEVAPPGPTQYSPNGVVEMENLHIGAGSDTGGNFFFNGLIDDVALFRTALSEADIQSIMTGGVGAFTGAGTPLSIFSIVVGPNPDQVTISWNSQTGATYAVERTPDLAAASAPGASWDELTDSVASEGMTTTYTDTVPAGSTKIFYRVRKTN